MPLLHIREDAIRHLSKAESFRQGYDYYETGAIRKLWVKESIYYAKVGRSRLYKVVIYEKEGTITSSCTCPHIWGGICKHAVATMLAISRGDSIEQAKDDALISNKELPHDCMSFVDGSKAIDRTSSKYKNEILSEMKRLKGKESYDKNPEKHESLLQSIVDKFVAKAGKYALQKNYKAAITIYQGICDACVEGLRYKYHRSLSSIIFRTVQDACVKISEFVPYLKSSLSDKIPYFDYLVEIYYSLGEPEEFRAVFTQAAKTPEDAAYILDKTRLDLPPHTTMELLSIKGDYEEVVTFGENHYVEHPEIALPLAEFYLIHGQRSKAISLAKKTLKILQKSKTGDPFEFFPYIPEEKIRLFLNSCYSSTINYAKA